MTRRIAILVAVVGLLAAAIVVDRAATTSTDGPVDGRVDVAAMGHVVRSSDALGSTWYCAAGSAGDLSDVEVPADDTADEAADDDEATADDDGEAAADDDGEDGPEGPDDRGPVTAEHTIVVANVSDVDRVATITVHPGREDPVVTTVEVASGAAERIELADLANGPAVAAVVEVPGGGMAVAHELVGPAGSDSAPCASTSSDVWHFAWGDTSRDARHLVALFNPFPGDAVVDMRFVTADGVREPQALTGIVVPGGSVVLADVKAEVQRRDQVSATVTVRSGQVVAERLQTFDGSAERSGLAVDLGVPVPQPVWVHPYGRYGPDVGQDLVVYNPSDAPAEVDVEITTGTDVVGAVAPFELTVRPGGFVVVDLVAESRVVDVFGQDEAEYTVTVRSLNGTPVVSDLVTRVDGTTVSSGTAATATTYVVVDPLATDAATSILRLVDLGGADSASVTVEVLRQGTRTRLDDGELVVPAAGRTMVDLSAVGTGPSVVVVTASSPIAGELVIRSGDSGDLTTRAPTPGLAGLSLVPVLAG